MRLPWCERGIPAPDQVRDEPGRLIEGDAVRPAGWPGWPSAEQVRNHAEAALKQVVAAAGIAQGMWRLLLADCSGCRVARLEPGQWRDDVLPGTAARDVRQRIDTARQRHEAALDVYVLATFAGAVAATGNSDAAALVLLHLASLHVHLGYPEDALRLLDAAGAQDVSEPMHRLLVRSRATITEHGQHQSNTDARADHDKDGKQDR